MTARSQNITFVGYLGVKIFKQTIGKKLSAPPRFSHDTAIFELIKNLLQIQHIECALNQLQTYFLYVYIPTTTSVAMNTTVKNKKDKVDRMFTQFFKISQLHSYKIH